MHEKIKYLFYEDAFRRLGGQSYLSSLNMLRTDPTLAFITSFRVAKKYGKKSFIGLIAYFIYKYYRKNYGIQIPLEVSLGRGILMPHFGGIVINSKTKIGSNCTILHGVTIGSITSGKREGIPTIESCVYIGPNAVIVGGVTIGRGSVIAPGAFVNFDVPAGGIVIGNPGKVVRLNDDHRYPNIKNMVRHLV